MLGYVAPRQQEVERAPSFTTGPMDPVRLLAPYGNAAAIEQLNAMRAAQGRSTALGAAAPAGGGAGVDAQSFPWSVDLGDELEAEPRGSASILYPTLGDVVTPPGPADGGFQRADGTCFANPELARQIDRGNANALRYAEEIATKELPPEDLPQPMPHLVGTPEYYDARHEDHLRRHEGQPPPPDYYLGYGRKYCVRFSEELYPQLSDAGKAWCIATRSNLQIAIEDALLANPTKFDEKERDSSAFHSFAFATHPKAYLDGGLADLPVADLVAISLTPDIGDLVTLDGLAQVVDVLPDVVLEKGRDALDEGVLVDREATRRWTFGEHTTGDEHTADGGGEA